MKAWVVRPVEDISVEIAIEMGVHSCGKARGRARRRSMRESTAVSRHWLSEECATTTHRLPPGPALDYTVTLTAAQWLWEPWGRTQI